MKIRLKFDGSISVRKTAIFWMGVAVVFMTMGILGMPPVLGVVCSVIGTVLWLNAFLDVER